MRRNWRWMIVTAAAALLSACSFDDESSATQAEDAAQSGQAIASESAPRVSGIPRTSTLAGASYVFQVAASDPNGDALTYTATGLPEWASMDARTGLLTGVPSEANVGVTADIFVSVSDGKTSTSLPPFRISIASAQPAAPLPSTPGTSTPNKAPTISGAPALSVQADANYSFTPSAADPEGARLQYSIANRPAWAAFSTTTGTLSGKPTRNQAGSYSNIVITVSDGSLTASLPAFSVTVSAANQAPTISGTPSPSAGSGSSYSFTPSASDPDGDTLAFSITGKPSWANFSTATGALTGTAQTGSYANIVISVSDGTSTQALPAFSLVVNAANSGTATLSWTAPTQNTDNSPLVDLAGYRVYHGTSAGNYGEVVEVTGVNNTSYQFKQLLAGTHYFAVAAVNTTGVESGLSVVGSKTIQ